MLTPLTAAHTSEGQESIPSKTNVICFNNNGRIAAPTTLDISADRHLGMPFGANPNFYLATKGLSRLGEGDGAEHRTGCDLADTPRTNQLKTPLHHSQCHQ
jgi:hypothetical protein